MSAKKVLKHNGYQGSVEYNLDKERLEGQVLHIKSLITYAGDTIAELKAAFQEEVNEYIADCKEFGVEPEKPYSGTFQIRLEPSVHRKLAFNAVEAGMGFNQFIANTLKRAVELPPIETNSWPAIVMERVSKQLEDTYSALTSFQSVSHMTSSPQEPEYIMNNHFFRASQRLAIDRFTNRRNVANQSIEFSS